MIDYTVKPGDTLSQIAATYHTTVAVLQAFNCIPNPDRISVGDIIGIPERSVSENKDSELFDALEALMDAMEKLPEYKRFNELIEKGVK